MTEDRDLYCFEKIGVNHLVLPIEPGRIRGLAWFNLRLDYKSLTRTEPHKLRLKKNPLAAME